MKEKIKAMLRPTAKWTDIFLIAAILSVLMNIGGEVISALVNNVIPYNNFFHNLAGSDSIGDFISLYFIFFGIWIVFFIICGVFKNNRPILKQLAPNKSGNTLKGALIGLAIGFGTNSFCILMSALMGDIHLSFNEFDPLLFFTFLIVVTIQCGAEEITDRAYLYQKLRRRYKNPKVAIVGNAVIFAALHLGNPGITPVSVIQIIEVGILFSLFVYYYDSLWAAITMHTGWNFCQSIFFGLPNSGIVSEYSLFKLEAASATNGFFYNTNFGVEGSVGSIILLAVIIAIIIMKNKGKPEKNDVWGRIAAEMGMENAETNLPDLPDDSADTSQLNLTDNE